MMTPKSLSSSTESSFRFPDNPSDMYYSVPRQWPICMTLHFSALNLSCHMLDHELRLSRSCCRVIPSFSVFILHQIFVSSANILISLWIKSRDSLTNINMSNGPSTFPVGLHSASVVLTTIYSLFQLS